MRTHQSGFTLLELLVVTSILGVLAAVAIPHYTEYKSDGKDRQAQVALRTVALAEEAYFLLHDEYVSCDEVTCPLVLAELEPLPSGVILEIVGGRNSFEGTAYHVTGTGTTFDWHG